MKFKAKIATGKVDLDGNILSPEALEMLQKSTIGKPISVEFIHKLDGQINTSELSNNNELFVTGSIENFEPSLIKGIGKLYAVPGFMRDGDDYKMIEVGLTYRPSDENLTPIEFTDD